MGEAKMNLYWAGWYNILANTVIDKMMSKGSSGRSKPNDGVKLYSVYKGSTTSNSQYSCSVLVTMNWKRGNAVITIKGTTSKYGSCVSSDHNPHKKKLPMANQLNHLEYIMLGI